MLSPVQLSQIISFVSTDGSFGLSRVLRAMFATDMYVAVSNWVVFSASTLQILKLCDLILGVLTSQPAAKILRTTQQRRKRSNFNLSADIVTEMPARQPSVQRIIRTVSAIRESKSAASLALWQRLSLRSGLQPDELALLIEQITLYATPTDRGHAAIR